jgi:hypothetical protein
MAASYGPGPVGEVCLVGRCRRAPRVAPLSRVWKPHRSKTTRILDHFVELHIQQNAEYLWNNYCVIIIAAWGIPCCQCWSYVGLGKPAFRALSRTGLVLKYSTNAEENHGKVAGSNLG